MPAILFRFLAFVAAASSAGAVAQELEIVHFNVGQGDATLILGPQQFIVTAIAGPQCLG